MASHSGMWQSANPRSLWADFSYAAARGEPRRSERGTRGVRAEGDLCESSWNAGVGIACGLGGTHASVPVLLGAWRRAHAARSPCRVHGCTVCGAVWQCSRATAAAELVKFPFCSTSSAPLLTESLELACRAVRSRTFGSASVCMWLRWWEISFISKQQHTATFEYREYQAGSC